MCYHKGNIKDMHNNRDFSRTDFFHITMTTSQTLMSL